MPRIWTPLPCYVSLLGPDFALSFSCGTLHLSILCSLNVSGHVSHPYEVPSIFVVFLSTYLRCATSRTVPGSIPAGVTGFFSDISLSDRTMVLGSTQPLVKMSTRNIPGGKGGRCVRLTNSPPSCAECHGIWEPKPSGTLWDTPGL